MSANLSVVEQLMKKFTELAKAGVSEKAMEKFVVEEMKRKFNEFIGCQMGNKKDERRSNT